MRSIINYHSSRKMYYKNVSVEFRLIAYIELIHFSISVHGKNNVMALRTNVRNCSVKVN